MSKLRHLTLALFHKLLEPTRYSIMSSRLRTHMAKKLALLLKSGMTLKQLRTRFRIAELSLLNSLK